MKAIDFLILKLSILFFALQEKKTYANPHTSIVIMNVSIKEGLAKKFLGVFLDENISWKSRISTASRNFWKSV